MKVEATKAQWAEFEEMQKAASVSGTDAAGAKKAGSIPQQDTVDISDEGKRKSAALQSTADESGSQAVADGTTSQAAGETSQTAGGAGQADGGAGGGDDVSGGGSGTATSVTVAELKEQLQTKKNAIKAKKDELEAAKALAESDLAKQDEVKRLKNSLATLEKEATKIQSAIYSS